MQAPLHGIAAVGRGFACEEAADTAEREAGRAGRGADEGRTGEARGPGDVCGPSGVREGGMWGRSV